MEKNIFKKEEIVSILTDQPINEGLLSYLVPFDSISVGQFVEIPIGSRYCVGVVWGSSSIKIDNNRLKYIARVLEIPPMTSELRKFLNQLANYTVNPLNKVFKLSLCAQNLIRPPKGKKFYNASDLKLETNTPKRQKIVEFLKQAPEQLFSMKELTSALDISPRLINELTQLGNIKVQWRTEFNPYQKFVGKFSNTLSISQKSASSQLRELVRKQTYSTTLLRGVTGSGKTEVYLDAVSEALIIGKQVLVLIPEIALSIDFVRRVYDRFKVEPGEWHSGVSPKERLRLYHAVTNNSIQLVIGARSSLFLPFSNLGLIVVDEEHDGSYKQEDGVCYHARDMAVMRASLSGAQVILASATPSLETYVNSKSGKYGRIDLAERYGKAILPDIEVLDLRDINMPTGTFISPKLSHEIKMRIDKGEQSLLFLNRRGYAPITICSACGFQIGCKSCDSRLVQHLFKKKLVCHQCGDRMDIPLNCPKCNTEGKLKAVGPGVEKVAEECKNLFPEARVGILSSDSIENIEQLQEKFSGLASGDIDIIVGTQLVSKGHNFPNITLVGVIDADLGLQGSDLRAAEKTFQSLRQVSGRAGRDKKQGKAFLQTYAPEHPVIMAIAAGNDEAFWDLESASRQQAEAPPFGKLVALVLSGPNEKELFNMGHELARAWTKSHSWDTQIFGPALAPVGKIRDRFRVRLLIKCGKKKNIHFMLRKLIAGVVTQKSVRILVDVDPQSFY